MKRRMKMILVMVLAMSMVFSLVACGSKKSDTQTSKDQKSEATKAPDTTGKSTTAIEGAADCKPVTLVYAEVNPEDSLMGKTANEFKKKVEELSGGTVKLDIQFGGVLGAEGDVLDTMIGGADTIDLARISAFSLNTYGTKLSSLLSVPFMVENRDHFWAIAASDYGQKVLDEPKELKLGVRGLFFAEEGFRHFFFKETISGIGDLKGKKIRVSTDPIMMGLVKGLGGNPTAIAFTELYSSLSSGVVDGAEQPIANYQSNAFNEVAPYMILDGHTIGAAEVIMTDAAWDKLEEPQQKAIVEAGKEASKFNAGLSEENENKCLEELKKEGVTFVEVKDLQPWRDACADTIATATKGMDEYVKEIQDLAK